MAQIIQSRIAEMLFEEVPLCDFSRTISELDTVLTRICGFRPQLTWDCDDVASFDMPGTRILLSFSESPYPEYAARLVISVGPSPIAPKDGQGLMVHAALCSRLVTRLKDRCEPEEIRWSDVAGVVTADEVDLLAEGLSQPQVSPRRPGIFTPGPAHDMPNIADLRALREALHPYGIGADFPAMGARLARQTVELAFTVALLPMTAVHFAAAIYRSMMN